MTSGMSRTRSRSSPWIGAHSTPLSPLLFVLVLLLLFVGATACPTNFVTLIGIAMPSSSYVIDAKSSRAECRIACWVDPSCKSVTVRPSAVSSNLFDCSMTQHNRPAVSTYVQNADAVSFVRRDDGFMFVGSRFCGVSPMSGNAGDGSTYCRGLSGGAYLADVKNVGHLREIIKLLRDFDVNSPAVVALSSYLVSYTKSNRWSHPDGSFTSLSQTRSTILEGINVTTTKTYQYEFFAFDVTSSVISLGPFTRYKQLPYICCSLS
ncbi:uncharacterized protein LOC143021316 [Oratosquilla oratoria]|uniref:uncharacterized protein LOC143021316 n=1 Tax=Oratosquilla oratoria TaxID=337810 RepID=UPI003F759E68